MKLASSRALVASASVVFAGLFAPSLASAQTVIQSWNFNSASAKSLQTYDATWAGWGAAGDATATTYTNLAPSGVTTNPRLQISVLPSSNGDTTQGVLYAHNSATSSATNRFVAVTTFAAVTVSDWTSLNIDWWQHTNNTGTNARALVQVGGAWYASSTTFTGSAANTFTNRNIDLLSPTIGLSTTSWYAVTFGDSQSISAIAVGTTPLVSPGSSTITGLGFYYNIGNTANNSIRIDNIALNGVAAVPEPASAAVLLGGIALAGVAAKRRRRG